MRKPSIEYGIIANKLSTKSIKLQKHYIAFGQALGYFFIDSNEKLPERERLEQIKGAFWPATRMAKDFVDTFKPYRSSYYIKRDAKQPLDGLYNFFKGIAYIVGLLLLLITLPIVSLLMKIMKYPEKKYIDILTQSYELAFSWLIDGVLSAIQGAMQFVTTPLTYLIKMPLRGVITYCTPEKDLLFENRPGIQTAIKEAYAIFQEETRTYFTFDGKALIDARVMDLTKRIHAKYKKNFLNMYGRMEKTHVGYSAIRDAYSKKNSGIDEIKIYLKLFAPDPGAKSNPNEAEQKLHKTNV